MSEVKFNDLLDAGVHFGHLKRKWNPNMAPYIFSEKKGIHIIDLNKTIVKLDQACAVIKDMAKSGKKILFVATKKQAKDIVAQKVAEVNMPYVTERWFGGMLTNFATIRKAVKKMSMIDKMFQDGTSQTMSKRERLMLTRTRAKLEKNLGSISDLSRLPQAIFIVDVLKEHIAVAEANKLNITSFAMVDTNSDPNLVDYAIPSNDDATKSISFIMDKVCGAIKEGLEERNKAKEERKASGETQKDLTTPEVVEEVQMSAAVEAEAKVAEAEAKVEEVQPIESQEAPAEAAAEEAPVEEAPAEESQNETEGEKPAE
ncbi:MAG: 30S ribosomal protein S2 [Bacteroidota bacterium]